MLRSISKFCSSSSQPPSLINQWKFNKSHALSQSKRRKYYAANPQLYKRYTKMKLPDMKQKDMVFPINIPIRVRYRFQYAKRTEIPAHDFLNFKLMTGNEILLYLENYSDLRPSELCGALVELGKKPGAEKIDWNSHEYIVNIKDNLVNKLPQYGSRVIYNLVIAFHRLKVFDPILWSGLHKECNKLLHLMKAKTFGKLYVIFYREECKAPKEMLERMTTMMPNYIRLMSPNKILNIFEILIKNNLLSYYFFEDIFLMMITKRNKWFGLKNYPKLIRLFIELKHFEDEEFWNKSILPGIFHFKEFINEENVIPLIEALNQLSEASKNKIKVDEYLAFINETLTFKQTKQKAIENNQLLNIILNDLKYYREKELDKLERKSEK